MTAEETDSDGSYDPENPAPPAQAPPLRRTAPQSDFTRAQVILGVALLALGIFITFGLPLVIG